MKKAIRIQQYIALLSVVLFLCKMLAWYLTNSVTVLTDALEGIVNMVAGFLGLFSISLAARPRDPNHPYGHGKAEFLSAAVEGTLITVAGLVIIYEAIEHLIIPHELEKLDIGLLIVAGSGAINFLIGKLAEKQGEKLNSMVLVSAGKHLATDAYSAVAIIIGLALLMVTKNKYQWLDSAVALCFAVIIIRTGYKVIRRSVSGIMDETDMVRLQSVIDVLQNNRQPQWVDMHHLRVLNHSSRMHVDAHLTIPWYFKISDAGAEIKQIDSLVKANYGERVEVFIQIEGCVPRQCPVCAVENCPVRAHAFNEQEKWELNNIWRASRHGAEADIV
ncbi:MAG: cation transporter [Taibaiella sp.]|nr:cation transporter [Taibaiella sp.]